MKKRLFILPLLFIVLINVIFYIKPTYADTPRNILIVGDSLSAGHGFDPQKSWTVLLQKKLKINHSSYQVINLSISGSTTSNGLSELPTALKKYDPKIIIIELGANDGLRGLDVAVIKNNLQKLITLAKKQSKVLLLSVRLPPNYGAVYNQKLKTTFADLAQENHIAFVPLFLSGIDNKPSLMQADGLHPTADAQPIILENIWPELEKIL